MRTRSYVAILTAAIFIGGLVYTVAPRERALPAAPRGPIVAFGDSLVYGFGASEGHDFVSLLQSRIGLPIVNAGIPRNTTADLLARIDSDVLELSPRVVILVIGGNDYLHQVPKETILTNLRSIIEQITSTGAQVVLVGVSELVYSHDYQALAAEEGILFVPAVMDRLLNNRTLMADMFHPNDAGYVIFADAVEPALLNALSK